MSVKEEPKLISSMDTPKLQLHIHREWRLQKTTWRLAEQPSYKKNKKEDGRATLRWRKEESCSCARTPTGYDKHRAPPAPQALRLQHPLLDLKRACTPLNAWCWGRKGGRGLCFWALWHWNNHRNNQTDGSFKAATPRVLQRQQANLHLSLKSPSECSSKTGRDSCFH